jgi:voltage-gated potassium channel
MLKSSDFPIERAVSKMKPSLRSGQHTSSLKSAQSKVEQKYHRIRREVIFGIAALVGVILTGTAWYHLVEGWRLLDSLYMTVITLYSVGFGEIHPLGDRGRLFTIALILMGITTLGYIVNRFTEAVLQGYFLEGIQLQQQRRLMDALHHHFILCGFGRIGGQIAAEFAADRATFIAIDKDPQNLEEARDLGYITLEGDATLDETLMAAGIERAVCIVAALPSDAENLYTVLSAKTLNPRIRTIARASNSEAVTKLERVGADVVISPYITGGKRMAAAALRPQVVDFLDGVLASGTDRAFFMEEVRINDFSPVVNQTLREAHLRSRTGALILAMRRGTGELITGPTADTAILSGDILICMGTADQLRSLNQILDPSQ